MVWMYCFMAVPNIHRVKPLIFEGTVIIVKWWGWGCVCVRTAAALAPNINYTHKVKLPYSTLDSKLQGLYRSFLSSSEEIVFVIFIYSTHDSWRKYAFAVIWALWKYFHEHWMPRHVFLHSRTQCIMTERVSSLSKTNMQQSMPTLCITN